MRFAAADALVWLGEFPQTKRELVYFFVGSEEVLRSEAKQTFLEDLHGNLPAAEYAVWRLIEFGEVDSVPHLVDFLKRRGSAEIALWFTLCGQPELQKVAEEWGEAISEVEYSAASWPAAPKWGDWEQSGCRSVTISLGGVNIPFTEVTISLEEAMIEMILFDRRPHLLGYPRRCFP